MYRLLVSCFLLSVQPRIYNIDPVLNDFSNVISLAGITALLLPNIRFGKNPLCNKDDDCFGVKKCCELNKERFCCDPEKYYQINPKFNLQR